jgi:hypothetical protein
MPFQGITNVFLFAFSAFARIGELVLVRDCDTSKVIQLADVSFSSENDKTHEVNVPFDNWNTNQNTIDDSNCYWQT